ncbi:hypothetical protein [Deinococcus reticulitermitis]|nr:hypothetical protein [Deinococcus reticulitermitis]
MTWPRRLILRAAEIGREREAQARLDRLTDLKLAAGLKLGEEYVDPKGKGRKPDDPYTTLKPLAQFEDALDRLARPWMHTPEAVQERLDWEQDRAYSALFGALQA